MIVGLIAEASALPHRPPAPHGPRQAPPVPFLRQLGAHLPPPLPDG